MSEFSGKAGTVYLEKVKASDRKYEVWFEDFCVLGTGSSEVEALENAGRHTIDILELIIQAKAEVAASTAPVLTEEESQLVVGAIPLQALPG